MEALLVGGEARLAELVASKASSQQTSGQARHRVVALPLGNPSCKDRIDAWLHLALAAPCAAWSLAQHVKDVEGQVSGYTPQSNAVLGVPRVATPGGV